MSNVKKIEPEYLTSMNLLQNRYPIKIDLVYASANHPENIFKTALYKQDAQLWLHRDFSHVVLRAAEICHQRHDLILLLKDGLRPVEAQAAMQETAIVKANPQWCAEGPDRLLSPPGVGAHPRGMAIDVTLADKNGQELDMGTPFDYLTTDPRDNPAARDYRHLDATALENRKILENLFIQAAAELDTDIWPINSEWWDFRFPRSITEQYAPISDKDLPADMRMILP